MAERESQHHVLDFFSADSSNRGEVLERESPPFQQALKPPPPVALSLRTRESSALSLKHIFDQIYSSAESNPDNNNNNNYNRNSSSSNNNNNNQHNNKSNNFKALDKNCSDFQAIYRDASNAGFQGGKMHAIRSGLQVNSFPEEQRSCVPDSKTFFAKVQTQSFTLHDLALGSPPLSQSSHLPLQQTSLPQVVTRPNPSSSARQPTAQLTIFYSGTVNVYDDVPADKANAIMLLAGTGNALPLKPTGEANRDLFPSMLKSLSPPSLLMGPASTAIGGITSASPASASIGKALGFSGVPLSNINNTPSTTTISSPRIPSPTPSVTMEPKPQAALKRPHTGIELPHARKASLARFLEKRKDRVQVKQNEEKVETSREEMPPSPKRPYLTALASPTINQ